MAIGSILLILAIIPVYQRPSDDELIDEAYAVAVQKIFLVYCNQFGEQKKVKLYDTL